MSVPTKALIASLQQFRENEESFNLFLEHQDEFNEFLENRDDFLAFLELSEGFTGDTPPAKKRGRPPGKAAPKKAASTGKRRGRPPGSKNTKTPKAPKTTETEEEKDYSAGILKALDSEVHGMNLVSLAEAVGEDRKTALKPSIEALLKSKQIEKAGAKFRIPGRVGPRGRRPSSEKTEKPPKKEKAPKEAKFRWGKAGIPDGLRDINARLKAQEEKPENKRNLPMIAELKRLQAQLRGEEPPAETKTTETTTEAKSEPAAEPKTNGPKLEAIKGGQFPTTIKETQEAIKAATKADDRSLRARLLNHIKKLKKDSATTSTTEKSRALSRKVAGHFKKRRGKPGASSSRKSR